MTIPTAVPSLIPVLTFAARGEVADGIANFFQITIEKDDKGHSWRSDNRAVRCVTDEDIKEASRILGPAKRRLLSGALDLRQGFEKDDALLREKGFQKIGEWAGAGVLEFIARDPAWARLYYPLVLTEQLKDVRLVMWFSPRKNQFTPALFCTDLRVGVFLKSLMEIRSCPQCGTLFLPEKNNVIYCSILHREAYRTGRSRWRKKQKSKLTVKKGKRGKAAV